MQGTTPIKTYGNCPGASSTFSLHEPDSLDRIDQFDEDPLSLFDCIINDDMACVEKIVDGLFYGAPILVPQQLHFIFDSSEYRRIGLKTITAIYERMSGVSIETIENEIESLIKSELPNANQFTDAIDEAILSDLPFLFLPQSLRLLSKSRPVPEAIVLMAIIHLMGTVYRDSNQDIKAVYYFDLATSVFNGDRALACRNELFLEGRGIGEINLMGHRYSTVDMAYKYLDNEANHGDEASKYKAHYQLGVIEEQRGSFQLALDHYTQAAQGDDPDALYKLGTFYVLGNADFNIDEDIETAFRFFLKAATANSPSTDALCGLGAIYLVGNERLGIGEDKSIATYYFQRAADFVHEKGNGAYALRASLVPGQEVKSLGACRT